ncbi:hypothetical protein DPMN_139360 [Dreissena polymorpha]|uniref:Uncharacterized protein n=1 Tax=Dreissena polymorpha TaxID=45954 RepID=A0A9D4G9D4_DREPO|nr:hypothetical protein DPMN_139360 [Dreissena polymorpha]
MILFVQMLVKEIRFVAEPQLLKNMNVFCNPSGKAKTLVNITLFQMVEYQNSVGC